jgi:hypothetical protein
MELDWATVATVSATLSAVRYWKNTSVAADRAGNWLQMESMYDKLSSKDLVATLRSGPICLTYEGV